MAERLIPGTPYLEVRGSSLARRVVFLRQGTVLHFVSLHTSVKWIPALYCWGWGEPCDGLASRPGRSINSPRHAIC